MRKFLFAALMALSLTAQADNSTDHKCAQDLIVQFQALQKEMVKDEKYKASYVYHFRLSFTSIMKPSDRYAGMEAYGTDIYTNYGVCDMSKYRRYKLLRHVFTNALEANVR